VTLVYDALGNKIITEGRDVKIKMLTMESSRNGIKWGTIIPLIGGSSLGCEKSTGSLPKFHLGFSKFSANDKHIRRYRPTVPYYNLDENSNVKLGQLTLSIQSAPVLACPP